VKLAIQGGSPAIPRPFKRYNPIGEDEARAATEVLRDGNLSQFLAAWGPDFYGGPKVQAFERACEDFFSVKHAVTTNSWTSGLVAAVGSLDVEPGDEILVSPWTMSASATAILHWNCIPVFVDIEPDTFCIDPQEIEQHISPRTKAIMSVDIFGQSADITALQAIADKHGLAIISDTAQAPAAMVGSAYAGTLTDIGGFSLNYHKHIHTGEGGILVTNDPQLAERMQLIRNHAEAVVGPKGVSRLDNMVGHNFRLGEIEAAIGIQQLEKLPGLVASRQRAAQALAEGLRGLPGLRMPQVRAGCTHVYYVFPMILELEVLRATRAEMIEALVAEGVEGLLAGYVNLHLLPMYQKKIAFGSSGFPWTADFARKDISYAKGICPVAERLHSEEFLGFQTCKFELSESEIESLIFAMRRVLGYFGEQTS
jgi:dTDP-4-amino-4,6-dideoxygalactose transaminase